MRLDDEKKWRPCPFCGSTEIKFDPCTLRVRCKKCRATSGLISRFTNLGMAEEDAARAAWNERANEKTN